MTKRTEIAVQILQGLVSKPDQGTIRSDSKVAVARAFELADMVLAEDARCAPPHCDPPTAEEIETATHFSRGAFREPYQTGVDPTICQTPEGWAKFAWIP